MPDDASATNNGNQSQGNARAKQLLQELATLDIVQGDHLTALQQQFEAKQTLQTSKRANKVALRANLSAQASHWERLLREKEKTLASKQEQLATAQVVVDEAKLELEVREKTLAKIAEGEEQAATTETVVPAAAETAQAALVEGVGMLRLLMQQQDWETVP